MPPATTAYADEEELKLLIKGVPTLLATDTAVVDEFSIPGVGSVDLLGVGLDGSVTLVECKLRKNPQIRREVTGQVLAYAGGLWRTTFDDFAARYASRAGSSLVTHLREVTGDPVEDEDALRAAVHATLASGSFRLVIAVDEITEELKLVVEYLNGHTAAGVQVFALEVDYAKDGDVEVLVPRLFGEGSAAKAPSRAAPGKLTEEDIVDAIDRLDEASSGVLHRLLEHGHRVGHHSVPGTVGMSYWYEIDGKRCSTWSVYPSQSPKPVVTLSIGSVYQVNPQRATAWLASLRSISTLAPLLKHITSDNMIKYPSIPVAPTLAEPGVLEAVLASIDENLVGPIPG